MKEKEPMVVEGRGSAWRFPLPFSMFLYMFEIFHSKKFKKNEVSPMCPLYRWTEETPEAGRKIGGNWGVGNLSLLTMGVYPWAWPPRLALA